MPLTGLAMVSLEKAPLSCEPRASQLLLLLDFNVNNALFTATDEPCVYIHSKLFNLLLYINQII